MSFMTRNNLLKRLGGHRSHKTGTRLGVLALIAVLALSFLIHAEAARAERLAAPQAAPALAPRLLPITVAQPAQPAAHPPTDAACRSCHGDSDAAVVFPSGETLPVEVDLAGFDASLMAPIRVSSSAVAVVTLPAATSFPIRPSRRPTCASSRSRNPKRVSAATRRT